jgi:hypothetical protein
VSNQDWPLQVAHIHKSVQILEVDIKTVISIWAITQAMPAPIGGQEQTAFTFEHRKGKLPNPCIRRQAVQ